jgi:2-polyprenyl-6-methoxyphenol hydroxylase-like FAD-dependent oxidoreductase
LISNKKDSALPSTMAAMALPLDVCIRGSGIVGRTLALLLARERLRVGLVGAPPPAAGPDVRAYALNRASKELLESLRCWPSTDVATPVTRMEITGDRGGEVTFDASEFSSDALAWIVDVPVLESLLRDAVGFQPQIEPLQAPAPARLTVVCEGRASSTRTEFGVDFEVAPYAQHAVAARLSCEQPHAGVARQWFVDGDILALLPMGGPQGNSVALVWSVSPERALRLQTLDADTFCRELGAACGHALGAMTLTSERRSWPLQRAQARQWSGRAEVGAWVLAGDAAHNVHPLAGQGLNLGLADVAVLARVLRERDYWRGVDDRQLLRRYERSRKAGMLALDAGMDGLQLLFAREGEGWSALRNWGMKSVQRAGPLKQWLARQAMDF